MRGRGQRGGWHRSLSVQASAARPALLPAALTVPLGCPAGGISASCQSSWLPAARHLKLRELSLC